MLPDNKNSKDEAAARQKRAARLRAQIEELKKGAASPVSSPPQKPQTPREFVEEKGRSITAKKRRKKVRPQQERKGHTKRGHIL